MKSYSRLSPLEKKKKSWQIVSQTKLILAKYQFTTESTVTTPSTHWTTEESWFDSRWGQETFSLFQIVQTDSAVQPAPLSRGTGGSCPGSKADRCGTHRLHQRSRLTNTGTIHLLPHTPSRLIYYLYVYFTFILATVTAPYQPTCHITHTHTHTTYLLTPWCRVLLEKLTGLQLVKKFPAFHETRRFITALTSVRHLSLSWASPIQSIYPRPTSWRSILILSTHLRLGLPCGSFPPGSPARPYTPPLLTYTRHMPSPSHSSRYTHNIRMLYKEHHPYLQGVGIA